MTCYLSSARGLCDRLIICTYRPRSRGTGAKSLCVTIKRILNVIPLDTINIWNTKYNGLFPKKLIKGKAKEGKMVLAVGYKFGGVGAVGWELGGGWEWGWVWGWGGAWLQKGKQHTWGLFGCVWVREGEGEGLGGGLKPVSSLCVPHVTRQVYNLFQDLWNRSPWSTQFVKWTFLPNF